MPQTAPAPRRAGSGMALPVGCPQSRGLAAWHGLRASRAVPHIGQVLHSQARGSPSPRREIGTCSRWPGRRPPRAGHRAPATRARAGRLQPAPCPGGRVCSCRPCARPRSPSPGRRPSAPRPAAPSRCPRRRSGRRRRAPRVRQTARACHSAENASRCAARGPSQLPARQPARAPPARKVCRSARWPPRLHQSCLRTPRPWNAHLPAGLTNEPSKQPHRQSPRLRSSRRRSA
mmetsp:Transcript_47406/g.141510  ORF Transcript_47406/g.141510 Transcript_47406/m.141510 type:complete len:232 (+) Transcript_47406:374-1069(+)